MILVLCWPRAALPDDWHRRALPAAALSGSIGSSCGPLLAYCITAGAGKSAAHFGETLSAIMCNVSSACVLSVISASLTPKLASAFYYPSPPTWHKRIYVILWYVRRAGPRLEISGEALSEIKMVSFWPVCAIKLYLYIVISSSILNIHQIFAFASSQNGGILPVVPLNLKRNSSSNLARPVVVAWCVLFNKYREPFDNGNSVSWNNRSLSHHLIIVNASESNVVVRNARRVRYFNGDICLYACARSVFLANITLLYGRKWNFDRYGCGWEVVVLSRKTASGEKACASIISYQTQAVSLGIMLISAGSALGLVGMSRE